MPGADPEAGLIAYLKADTALAALLAARVFAGELPPGETVQMPRKAIVLRASGGVSLTSESYAEHDTQRFDLFAFGETPKEAARVLRTAALAMRRLRRSVHAATLLHWANPAGGPSAGREPQTEWPRHFQSFQVMHALEEIS